MRRPCCRGGQRWREWPAFVIMYSSKGDPVAFQGHQAGLFQMFQTGKYIAAAIPTNKTKLLFPRWLKINSDGALRPYH